MMKDLSFTLKSVYTDGSVGKVGCWLLVTSAPKHLEVCWLASSLHFGPNPASGLGDTPRTCGNEIGSVAPCWARSSVTYVVGSRPDRGGLWPPHVDSYLVDPASSHMLVSKIKPCMSKYKRIHTVKLRMAH